MFPISSFTYSIPYMLLYILLAALSAFEFRAISKNQSILNIRVIVGIVFILFFGLRGYIGEDWSNYRMLFEATSTIYEDNFWGQVSDKMIEPGFMFFMILVKSIIPSYHFFVLLSTTIVFFALDKFFVRFSRYYTLSFICFLSFLGMGILIDAARNILSIVVFLYSLPYLAERKAKKYFLLNLIGITFHLSSIVYLLIYPFIHRKFKKWFLIAIFLVFNTIFLLQIPIISPIFELFDGVFGGKIGFMIKAYSQTAQVYGISFGFLERNITFLLVLIFYNRLASKSKMDLIMANFFILYFVLFTSFSEIGTVAIRMSMLFIMSYWILYPNILYLLKGYGNKLIFYLFFTLLSSLKLFTGTTSNIYYYENILFNSMDYRDRANEILKPYHESK